MSNEMLLLWVAVIVLGIGQINVGKPTGWIAIGLAGLALLCALFRLGPIWRQ